ncbi:hypothetical protein SORBI_3009G206200 [Sorghum bicolor]|uniref:tRNA nucleotidyltransferase/poly(A) polymerase RNA and SrmB- binding domain-containing protein n=1 Tax=Sorghum bicolor TaxID=4558 RepID=A0A1B6P9L6_SORBI|nr:hypothetical protein SORBI_3009G206200 [Sorghum bicolor]
MRAGGDTRLRRELCSRVSRERINREVSLMLVSKHPVMAMKYIEEMGLFRVVFTFPGNSDHPIDDHCARSCIATLEEFCMLLDSIENSVFSGNIDQRADHRLICMYAALFLILSEAVYMDQNDEKVLFTCFS